MLKEANHWVDWLTVGVDALLLLRILLLKLQRSYFLITLACVLVLFFDAVGVWLDPQSREAVRVFIYSRFLFVFIYPAAAFEVWEEVRKPLGRFRKLALFRIISSLLIVSIFGFAMVAFAGGDETGDQSAVATFAVILWAASTTASVAFLWSMNRVARLQKVELPRNTFVWLVFFSVNFALQVVGCIFVFIGPLLKSPAIDILELTLDLPGVAIALWCAWSLRSSSAHVPSTSEKVGL